MPKTCEKCGDAFAIFVEIEGKKRNFSKRRFCLACSPFGKHNTSQYPKNLGVKRCPRCKETRPLSAFYMVRREDRKDTSSYCKQCTSDECRDRGQRQKQQFVDYKGGKCEKCGYDKFTGALDFHHTDPSKKDFIISKKKSVSFNDCMRAELDKCVLLCANCHRERHAGIE